MFPYLLYRWSSSKNLFVFFLTSWTSKTTVIPTLSFIASRASPFMYLVRLQNNAVNSHASTFQSHVSVNYNIDCAFIHVFSSIMHLNIGFWFQ